MDLTNMDDNRRRRRKPSIDLSTMVYGKVPPQAKDIEEAILGAIMIEKSAYYRVSEILKPECFYVETHQKIFRAFHKLYEKGSVIDLLTTVEKLKEMEELDSVGGAYALTKLTNSVVSSANIRDHALIIFQKWIQREMIRIGGEMIADSYEDSTDPFDLLDQSERKMRDVSIAVQAISKSPLEDVAMQVITDFERKAYYSNTEEEDPNAIYTGFPEWDRINGELFKGGLYVIASRPAMGKSTFAVELICRAGKKIKIGFINGEMTNKQILIRMGCNLLDINNALWKKRHGITEEEIQLVADAMQAAIQLNVLISDKRDMASISRQITSWVTEDEVKLIVADILTIFQVPEELAKYMNDTQQMNWKLAVFNFLAKHLNIPIIIFTHMNRSIEGRSIKEPVLSDLKSSGNIEDFAYQVSFLHRPEVYETNNDQEEDAWGENIKGLLYQIIVKHRDGELGRLKFNAFLHKSQIKEREEEVVSGWRPQPNVPFDFKSRAANDIRLEDGFNTGDDIGDDEPF